MKRSTGFTLIELLIVVAIIAILAAIAVPNFLEAQMRAKISRVKADMRTEITAIESYGVDYNKYPWGEIHFLDPPQSGNWGFVPASLTTPVAYLTSHFADPFAIFYRIRTGAQPGQGSRSEHVGAGHQFARYRIMQIIPFPGTVTKAQWLPSYKAHCWTSALHSGASAPLTEAEINTPPYFLTSVGPDLTEDALPRYIFAYDQSYGAGRYDATNGTASNGDIARGGGMSGE